MESQKNNKRSLDQSEANSERSEDAGHSAGRGGGLIDASLGATRVLPRSLVVSGG
jgi:hypothetical protein